MRTVIGVLVLIVLIMRLATGLLLLIVLITRSLCFVGVDSIDNAPNY